MQKQAGREMNINKCSLLCGEISYNNEVYTSAKNITMKSNTFCILVCMLLIGCSGVSEKTLNKLKRVPEGTQKCIIRTYYYPLFHDGAWICGKEYDSLSDYIPDTTYYDQYGNTLLYIRKDREVIRNTYILPEKHRLDLRESASRWDSYLRKKYIYDEQGIAEIRNIGKFGFSSISVAYQRDDIGKLRQKIEYDSKGNEYKRTKYDANGYAIEILTEKEKILITRNLQKDGQITIVSNTYNDDRRYLDNKGLREERVETIDVKTNKLLHRVSKQYQYGIIHTMEDLSLKYDEEGRIIEESVVGKSIGTYSPMPSLLNDEESEEYIREHFIKNPKYRSIDNIKKISYNLQGDIDIYTYMYRDLFENFVVSTNIMEYVYNENNEWIQKIEYQYIRHDEKSIKLEKDILGITFLQNVDNQPRIISKREIRYY